MVGWHNDFYEYLLFTTIIKSIEYLNIFLACFQHFLFDFYSINHYLFFLNPLKKKNLHGY